MFHFSTHQPFLSEAWKRSSTIESPTFSCRTWLTGQIQSFSGDRLVASQSVPIRLVSGCSCITVYLIGLCLSGIRWVCSLCRVGGLLRGVSYSLVWICCSVCCVCRTLGIVSNFAIGRGIDAAARIRERSWHPSKQFRGWIWRHCVIINE